MIYIGTGGLAGGFILGDRCRCMCLTAYKAFYVFPRYAGLCFEFGVYCWFSALFSVLNVSKTKSFQPMGPVFVFYKIVWFGRLKNCGFFDIVCACVCAVC